MSTQTMIDAAAPILEVPGPTEDYRNVTVPRALTAALIAFAEELEALATSTLAANKRGAKGKATIYTEGAALLRGRAAELETHGPISDAEAKRRSALAETEAGAARLLENARPNGKDMEKLNALVGAPQTESTALEVEQLYDGVAHPDGTVTCGVKDEMGYICDLPPHAIGTSHAVLRPDGSISVKWPDTRSDIRQSEIASYLKGERDELPPFDAAQVLDLGPVGDDLKGIVTALSETVAPKGTVVNPTPDLYDVFTTPAPSYVVESDDPFTVADASAGRPPWLLEPNPVTFGFAPSAAPGGVPDHVSYSQITTAEACGLQLRIKKRDLAKGQPAYYNVGGSAFHACVELVERRRLGLVSHGTVDQVLAGDLAACAALFVHNFDLEIAAALRESGIPVEKWKVGGKGTEGDAWWRHNGALMLRDYVAWSEARHAEGWAIYNAPGRLGIELELNEPIGNDLATGQQVMLNARLDQVWFRWVTGGPVPTLHLHIEDNKSGAKLTADTFQLGLYGHALSRAILRDLPPSGVQLHVTASYYDARNGKSSDPIEPLTAHSWDEITYRALTTLAMHANGVYPANPNAAYGGPCGLCDVRHRCPIMAMKD